MSRNPREVEEYKNTLSCNLFFLSISSKKVDHYHIAFSSFLYVYILLPSILDGIHTRYLKNPGFLAGLYLYGKERAKSLFVLLSSRRLLSINSSPFTLAKHREVKNVISVGLSSGERYL